MNVNIKQTVKEYLPTFMRGSVVDLVMALVSGVEVLYTQFTTWKSYNRKEVNVNSQVAVFEKYLSDRLGGNVVIKEGDGKPVDFTVNVGTVVDDNFVRAIVNKHKLFGRNSIISVANQDISAVFTDYVCEMVEPAAIVRFTDYVCEQEQLPEITTVTYNSYVCELERLGEFNNDYKNDYSN